MIELLRHGQTTETGPGVLRGQRDDALSPAGWQQMQQGVDARLAANGQRLPWQAVVSSPLQRCRCFAEDLAARHALPLSIDARLMELDFGDWEGRAVDELLEDPTQAPRLQAFWDDPWAHAPTNGESFAHFEARVWQVWLDLQRQYARQSLLVVTHSGVMRLLRYRLEGQPRNQMLAYEIPHGSIYRPAVA